MGETNLLFYWELCEGLTSFLFLQLKRVMIFELDPAKPKPIFS